MLLPFFALYVFLLLRRPHEQALKPMFAVHTSKFIVSLTPLNRATSWCPYLYSAANTTLSYLSQWHCDHFVSRTTDVLLFLHSVKTKCPIISEKYRSVALARWTAIPSSSRFEDGLWIDLLVDFIWPWGGGPLHNPVGIPSIDHWSSTTVNWVIEFVA